MTTSPSTVVEFSDDELRIVSNALHNYLNVFGHEEAEVVHAVQRLLAKLESAQGAVESA